MYNRGLSDKFHKSNSTSSIYLSSTINSPNAKSLIKAVTMIIQSQIQEDIQLGKSVSSKSDLFYFSEEKYIKENQHNFDEENLKSPKSTPTQEEIIDYIEALYNCAQFSPECCVLSLIYINRIIALTGLSLEPTNWRPLLLISLMISQKVWDDKYLSNADFSYIFPFFNTKQINLLEMKFLEMIQYNVYVKDSLYTKYFLELKCLVPELNKLESNSKSFECYLKKYSKTGGVSIEYGHLSTFVIN